MKTNIFVLAAVFIQGFISVAQADPTCAHRIFLLPQTHATTGSGQLGVAPDAYDQTAKSQYNIAKYLEKHPAQPVFSERFSSDLTVDVVKLEERETYGKIKSWFPDGLPAKFDELNSTQKEILAKGGGETTSFILRNTDMIHKVYENDAASNLIFKRITKLASLPPAPDFETSELHRQIFDVREMAALDQVNQYFDTNPDQHDVVLIYGSDHYDTLKSHPEKFARECIVVPFELQSAITTPYADRQPSQPATSEKVVQ